MFSKTSYSDPKALGRAIALARGLLPADTVLRNVFVLDVFAGAFVKTDIAWADGRIVGLGPGYSAAETIDAEGLYAVPGFIDAHVHIESSLMTPARFQEAVLPCGTTSVIWDPHEIANVWGNEGIRWALEKSEGLALDVFVMVPSCVPSTNQNLGLESSGANLLAADIAPFREHPRVLGLAEMMNFPGLLQQDPEVMQKLIDFQEMKRDGHCPGLSGKELNAYAVAGIHSCHESTSLSEAREKMLKGIHVLIREGSCAKDANALIPLINPFSSAAMALCSDDRNPLDIIEEGHISAIIEMALKQGKSPEEVFRTASYGPAQIYGLGDRGALAPGYQADLCLVKPRDKSWQKGFQILSVFKKGRRVDLETLKKVKTDSREALPKNMHLPKPILANFDIAATSKNTSKVKVRLIEIIPQQILTHKREAELPVLDGKVQADLSQDILKIAVFERHRALGYHATAFVQGFGLKSGAIATSINHDAHNIIVVGSSESLMLAAINELIRIDGGIVVVSAQGKTEALTLPIAGLMTDASPEEVAKRLRQLKALASEIGCVLSEPFLQLSFLALPVIPSLKITDRGLVDVEAFTKVPVLTS